MKAVLRFGPVFGVLAMLFLCLGLLSIDMIERARAGTLCFGQAETTARERSP
jgi:hypothetical protein